jgi:glucuronate isomerase
MKKFMDENFLLSNKTAEYLYHGHAAKMPIIDYHCHLSPAQLARNDNFRNITQAWLYGDHYKWRAMRTNGIDERYCTGNATDEEKFFKWAETVPKTLRNPLYQWTHLELQRYFGIHELLNPNTARGIFEKTSSLLRQEDFRPMALLKKMQVEIVCTTDDPLDNLEHHRKLAENNTGIRVIPAWRPDKLMATGEPAIINAYLDNLSLASGMDIDNYQALLDALKIRHDFFHANGCRLSDHGIENFYAAAYTDAEIQAIFRRIRQGTAPSQEELLKYRSSLLFDLAVMDHEKGWTQQFHIGAMRNNNSRMFDLLGPDAGFDSIGDQPVAVPMSRFLDRLEKKHKLARTILYNLNPADNEMMATMTGNFQNGSIPGKIQWGSAWWFLDQKDGMEKQLNALSNLGLLSRFVGMLTDSRSLLSYPRHEYFRRILCNLIGKDVENGEMPDDKNLIGQLVEDICYNNAKQYFGFIPEMK